MQALDWKVVVPSTIALISLLISLLMARRNWWYSDVGVRYVSRNQYMNALFDIDRQLIDRPELWAIYDNHEMALSRSNEAGAKARRDAFLYLHFNLFETVYVDYNKILQPTQHDNEFWKSWEAWMYQFFEGSSEARALFTRPMAQTIFSKAFVDYINSLLQKIAPERTAALIKSAEETSSGSSGVTQ